MEGIKQFFQRLKFVKRSDITAIPVMCIGFIVSLPFRLMHKNLWLVCERKDEARDNGYWFFKYLCENHPEIEAVYAINNTSMDYPKVQELGKVIQFGSLKHWIYYFTAKRNISSQKEGKPNAALCYVLEVYLGARKNRAYIRHGICKDDQRWVYYDVTKMNLFVCSAQREFDFVQQRFGYPKENVKLVGLCRFDNLLSSHEVKRQITLSILLLYKKFRKGTLIYKNSAANPYEDLMQFQAFISAVSFMLIFIEFNSGMRLSWLVAILDMPMLLIILSDNCLSKKQHGQLHNLIMVSSAIMMFLSCSRGDMCSLKFSGGTEEH